MGWCSRRVDFTGGRRQPGTVKTTPEKERKLIVKPGASGGFRGRENRVRLGNRLKRSLAGSMNAMPVGGSAGLPNRKGWARAGARVDERRGESGPKWHFDTSTHPYRYVDGKVEAQGPDTPVWEGVSVPTKVPPARKNEKGKK